MISYPKGHVGGVTWETDSADLADTPPPEVVWHLVLDRAWTEGKAVRLVNKLDLDDRYVFRSGRFAEAAVCCLLGCSATWGDSELDRLEDF